MFVRATLVFILAVVVAMSRPIATGGDHDLVAVGVRIAGGENVHLVMSPATDAAKDAYRALLRSSAHDQLLQGTEVHAHLPAELLKSDDGTTLVSLAFYGKGSRAGRAIVTFSDEGDALDVTVEALEAARPSVDFAWTVSSMSSAVSGSAARLVLGAGDPDAMQDAFDVLVKTNPDSASAEAQRIALDQPEVPDAATTVRRILAVRVLQSLGGDKVFPMVFEKLRNDRDENVASMAK
ncbi:MAG: hypothetical protein ACYTDX_00905 [Planctomycetota bacterium]|jgi:hypothetical protein